MRVSARGEAVFAGRAAPGAELAIRDGGRVIGRVTADRRGDWVFVPDRPLDPGARELTLVALASDGGEIEGSAPVILVVPDPPARVAGAPPPAAPGAVPLALLAPTGGASRVLQAPPASAEPSVPPTSASIPAAAAGRGPAPPGRLQLETVDYDDRGEIRFSGAAPAGAPVRVYVDNAPVGEATASAEGRWVLTPTTPLAPGTHTLRVDQVAPAGRVASRVEVPFQRVAVSPEQVRPGSVVVQPGQNLWRIARATYGHGLRYTVIYRANREAIRDPNRIYPGQVFALPEAPPN